MSTKRIDSTVLIDTYHLLPIRRVVCIETQNNRNLKSLFFSFAIFSGRCIDTHNIALFDKSWYFDYETSFKRRIF